MSYIDDTRHFEGVSRNKIKCKCGHTMAIPVQCDYMICTYCGNKVNNATKEHFEYKIRKEIEKKASYKENTKKC